MLKNLKLIARDLKRDLPAYQLALKDPRTPRLAKSLLALALAYASLPFDVIPDFIPYLGRLDDAVIIPLMIRAALLLIPQDVMAECRTAVEFPKVRTGRVVRLKPKKSASRKGPRERPRPGR